jgi:hypothetical protein
VPEFRYVTGEDGRVFPSVPVTDGVVAAWTLNVGDVITAAENPDPSRFEEVVSKTALKTKAPS